MVWAGTYMPALGNIGKFINKYSSYSDKVKISL